MYLPKILRIRIEEPATTEVVGHERGGEGTTQIDARWRKIIVERYRTNRHGRYVKYLCSPDTQYILCSSLVVPRMEKHTLDKLG